MEIITLLKANIRKKKSTFISIMLLMVIIVAAMTSILSVQNNYDQALEDAFIYENAGDVTAFVNSARLTEELCSAVENSKLVQEVTYFPAICTNGTSLGDKWDGNEYWLMEMRSGIRLYNEELNGFEEEIPALEKGEIYLPLGLKSKLECNIGDTIRMELICGYFGEFTIKGFVQEPCQGAMNIGWKQVFISKEDYEALYDLCHPLETDEVQFSFTMVQIKQAQDVDLSPTRFQRELNLETGIIDISIGALNKDQSLRYSTVLPDVVMNIVLAFVICLFAIILIVMSHSISTEIEIDYVTFGILKAQGFSKEKIRLIIMLQYLLAQTAGIVAGLMVAVPIERTISNICMGITGVLPKMGLSFGKSLLCMGGFLFVSALLILLKTRKVAKISPVRAISGGREEIYFDSRLNMPISKKALSASLSFRQFISAKKRYLGAVFIVAILVFCMVTVNLTGNIISSREALSSMGLAIPDLEVYYLEKSQDTECWTEIEKIIESHTKIKEKNTQVSSYASVNGENLLCDRYEYPEYINGISKGREPLYDNEILITEMVAELLEVEIGDEVTVSFQENQETFLISGFYQSGSDSGMAFAMNFEGAKKVGIDTSWAYHYYVLEDTSELKQIEEEIYEKYGSFLGVWIYDEEENSVWKEYEEIVDVLKIIIYTFSILFAFVVVRLVCTKTFVQERRDIGIYKAIGFTTRKLRLGFGIRFFIIAILGSVLGAILSVLFSAKVLGAVLSLIGLSRVTLEYSFLAVFIPTVAIALSFFLFAYLASSKIRKVEIKELIIE